MSDPVDEIYFTPPLRSVAGEASSTDGSVIHSQSDPTIQSNPLIEEKSSRERSSSDSSSSSSDSLVSFTLHVTNEDDLSSNDETNQQWQQLTERLHSLRRLSSFFFAEKREESFFLHFSAPCFIG